jgi:hypothetical protein
VGDLAVSELENRVNVAIRETMDRAPREKLRTSGWTLRIKEALTSLGLELGFEVRGARPQKDPSY